MKKPESPPPARLRESEIPKFLTIFEDATIIGRLSKIDREYPYWDPFKYKVKDLQVDPVLLWKLSKRQREISITKIRISDLPGFEFKYNSTVIIQKYLHEFDLNLGGLLEGGSIIPRDDKNRYLISSIMEEAIASSQIEGAVTTRENAKEMLRSKREPRNHSERMILNNYRTIKRIMDLKNEPLTPSLIKEIHSVITQDTLDDPENEGRFRSSNNVNVVEETTGEIFYSPPDFRDIEKLIDDLCVFANNNSKDDVFIHPIVKAVILHFLIGYIHPFVDGNGRTARAIFYWYLISKGYWLIEYLSISRIILKSKVQYAKAYLHVEYDENDLTYFIHYNLKSLNLALQSLKEYINRKITEKKSMFHVISKANINQRQAEIIRELITDPQKSFTIKEVQNIFDVVYQTARTDLLNLVLQGFLRERTVGKQMIFFRSDSFEDMINKL